MRELGKPFLKQIRSKQQKKQKIKVKMPHVNKKNQWREMKICFKQKTRSRMNYEGIVKTF